MRNTKIVQFIIMTGIAFVVVAISTVLLRNVNTVYPIFSDDKYVKTISKEKIFQNHLDSTQNYIVTGDDAYVVYEVDIESGRGLKIKFQNELQSVGNVQIFFAGKDGDISKQDSLWADVNVGTKELLLQTELKSINYIRLDFLFDEGTEFQIEDISIDTKTFDFQFYLGHYIMYITGIVIMLIVLNKRFSRLKETETDSIRATFYNSVLLLCNAVFSHYLVNIINNIAIATDNHISRIRLIANSVAIFVVVFLLVAFLYDKIIKLQVSIWSEDGGKIVVLFFYVVCLGLFIYQMQYFTRLAGGFPDEIQHVSYIAYIKETHNIIPHFEDMYILQWDKIDSGTVELGYGSLTNYLGHPPLYYWIMQLANGIHFDGDIVFVNIDRLRNFSQLIAACGMALSLYIGFSRIKKPLMQILYAIVMISLPNFTFGCAGVNNDTLTLLVMAFFVLGILRFFENKKDYLTFSLVAIGISLGLLTKLTVGAMMVFTIFAVVVYVLVREKKLTSIFNKYFFGTCWIYILVAIYFITIIMRYGGVQPSLKALNYEQYINSGFVNPGGEVLFLKEYFDYFISNLKITWVSVVGNGFRLIRPSLPFYNVDVLGLLSIVAMPIICFFLPSKEKENMVAGKLLLIGVACTFAYHFLSNYRSHLVTAYYGACSSRYYFCSIPIIALLVNELWSNIYEYIKSNKILVGAITTIVLTLCMVMIYDAYVYVYLHNV